MCSLVQLRPRSFEAVSDENRKLNVPAPRRAPFSESRTSVENAAPKPRSRPRDERGAPLPARLTRCELAREPVAVRHRYPHGLDDCAHQVRNTLELAATTLALAAPGHLLEEALCSRGQCVDSRHPLAQALHRDRDVELGLIIHEWIPLRSQAVRLAESLCDQTADPFERLGNFVDDAGTVDGDRIVEVTGEACRLAACVKMVSRISISISICMSPLTSVPRPYVRR
jgi:hypothetical protein